MGFCRQKLLCKYHASQGPSPKTEFCNLASSHLPLQHNVDHFQKLPRGWTLSTHRGCILLVDTVVTNKKVNLRHMNISWRFFFFYLT